FAMPTRPPTSTPFPYTTLFRSVAAGLAAKAEVQFAYAIGHPQPVSVHVDTFGTGTVSDDAILDAVLKIFSFKPADIVIRHGSGADRKSTRLNSSHDQISYAVFC